MIRIGSMFSGAGGLDVAVEAVTGGETVWHAEVDPHASKVLAARWPDVSNLGDVTEINYGALRFHLGRDRAGLGIDVLVAGFPCQDVSQAGLRAGLAGRRSGLWSEVVRAIAALTPKAVVIENVRGLLSSKDAETGQRAIEVVLDGLGQLGYQAQWMVLPASAIGAPHRRDRVFIVARRGSGQHVRVETPKIANLPMLPTPTGRDHKGQNQRNDATCLHGAIVDLLPTPRASDSTGAGIRGEGGINLREAVTHYGTPEWGKYETAVRRWEGLTRPAPYPVEPNKNGRPRLVAAFSEWMMGWPLGWVTDLDIARTHQLKIIGNGVVPHQAEAALRLLDLPSVVG